MEMGLVECEQNLSSKGTRAQISLEKVFLRNSTPLTANGTSLTLNIQRYSANAAPCCLGLALRAVSAVSFPFISRADKMRQLSLQY